MGISMRGRLTMVVALIVTASTFSVTGVSFAGHGAFTTSAGIYRVPYADGLMVTANNDHHNHPNQVDRVDMAAGQSTQIVAAASGIIRGIRDMNGDDYNRGDDLAADGVTPNVDANEHNCLNNANVVGQCSDYNNYVWIEHPNGEWTKYTHFETGSVSIDGMWSVGDTILVGQPLGTEGNVGSASGPHLHHEVAVPTNNSDTPFSTLGGFVPNSWNVVATVCFVDGDDDNDSLYTDGESYTAGPCVNTAPTADAGGPYEVDEGSSIQLDGSGSGDPHNAVLSFSWSPSTNLDDSAIATPTYNGVDDTVDNISLTVSDVGGDVTPALALSDDDVTTVTVNNVAPTLSNLSATAIDEDGSTTLSGTISDPGTPDTFTLDINWGDPLSPGDVESVNLPAGTTNFSINHQYLDDNPTATASDDYTISVTVEDDDGGSDSDSTMVTVSNLAPTIDTIAITSPINEDGTATLSGTYSDVGTLDTHTLDVDWDGDAVFDETVQVSAGAFSVDHQYLDDNPTGTPSDTFPVNARLSDDDAGTDSDSASLTVNNVDPAITDIVSSATFEDKAEEGETVTVSGAFTDVGTLDTHTATVDWGDGNVTAATVAQGSGSGTYTADHAYAAGGVYIATVTVTDDDTGEASDTTLAVVSGVGINGGVLQIVGTAGDDHVEVFMAAGEVDVFADFVTPHHRRFDPADVESIEVWLCEGDDHGKVHQSITVDAVIHGGAGADMLWGGSGHDFIEGGDGNDMIWGRVGDDELHGDDGDDRLTGGKGLDILNGGPGSDITKQ